MRLIPIKNNIPALVDDSDFELVNKHSWCASRGSYAVTNIAGKAVFMHRLIMDVPDGLLIDHKNHNGFDNRRENLRLATVSQNGMNRGRQSNNRSGFKGVCKANKRNLWRAQIKDGEKTLSKYFKDKVKAAEWYDSQATKRFGEFAVLNFQ